MEDQDRLTQAICDRYRIDREIEIAAKLPNPHIPPHFDSGEADGFLAPKPLPVAHRSNLP